jgi:hypothetical protein
MSGRYSIEIYLPLFSNTGARVARRLFVSTRDELVDTFGGMTAYSRSPATGVWAKPGKHNLVRDDIIIYEVLARRLSRTWWSAYKLRLAQRFKQHTLLIRAQKVDLL